MERAAQQQAPINCGKETKNFVHYRINEKSVKLIGKGKGKSDERDKKIFSGHDCHCPFWTRISKRKTKEVWI